MLKNFNVSYNSHNKIEERRKVVPYKIFSIFYIIHSNEKYDDA